MKKLTQTLLVALFTFISVSLKAQVKATELPTGYIRIVGFEKLLSNKVTVSIDFGQEQKMLQTDFIVDESGNKVIFNSMIDALNYLSKYGYEFVNAYAISNGNQNVYNWILHKD